MRSNLPLTKPDLIHIPSKVSFSSVVKEFQTHYLIHLASKFTSWGDDALRAACSWQMHQHLFLQISHIQ